MEYKVGDVVVIHKPADVCQNPKWMPEMNEYDGKTAVITNVVKITSRNFTYVRIKNDGGRWRFNALWLEPYEDEDDEELEAEDIWNLM